MIKPDEIVLPGQQPDMTSASSSRELDRSLVHGMAWTGIMKWSGQVLTWVATILVARMLTPADYGIMAMATAFIGIVGMISEFGVGSAVLNFRDLGSRQDHSAKRHIPRAWVRRIYSIVYRRSPVKLVFQNRRTDLGYHRIGFGIHSVGVESSALWDSSKGNAIQITWLS